MDASFNTKCRRPNTFNTFQSWNQHAAFCISVVGFLQSLVSPELGKIFCQGIKYVVRENKKIGGRAQSLMLGSDDPHDHPYYRRSRLDRTGLGFQYRADACGYEHDGWNLGRGDELLKTYVEQKRHGHLADLINMHKRKDGKFRHGSTLGQL